MAIEEVHLQNPNNTTCRSPADLATATAAIAAITAHAQAPGVVVALSSGAVSYVASTLEAPLASAIGNLQIPDQRIHEDGFDVHVFDMHTFDFDCTNCVSASLGAPADASIAVSNFGLRLHVHYDYQHTSFPPFGGSGTCDFHIDNSNIGATVQFGASAGKPTIAVASTVATIGSLDQSCSGISGAILNIIGDLFKNTIKGLIESQAQSAITSVINTQVETILAGLDLDIPITNGFAVARFDLVGAPSSPDGQYLSVPMIGDVIAAQGGSDPAQPPPPLPPYDTAHPNFLQLIISSWTFESALDTYAAAGRLDSLVSYTALPSWLPIALNTTDIGLFAPGLPQSYPGDWMQIAAAVGAGGQVNISTAGGVTASAPFSLAFQVLPSAGGAPITAFTLGCTLQLGINVAITPTAGGGVLTVQVEPILAPLSVLNSTVGPVNVAGLGNLTAFVLNDVIIPLINSALAGGIPLPTLQGLTLVNPTLAEETGFVVLSTSFQISIGDHQPTATHRPSALLGAASSLRGTARLL